MNRLITTQTVVAHSQCPRKAFYLLHGEPQGNQHILEQVLAQRAASNRSSYVVGLPSNELETSLDGAISDFVNANVLRAGDLLATCDVLTRRGAASDKTNIEYEPHLVIGTHSISKENKLALAFAGYAVGETKGRFPVSGVMIPFGGEPKRVRLSPLYANIRSIVATLRAFANGSALEAPPLILNQNCAKCPFHDHCLREAKETDNLTLLERMKAKLLRRYAKKGVFTVNQLSYLFTPRRRRKRSLVAQPSFNIELQALAIRTNKIYLHEPPALRDHPVEFYLDIEGIPDQNIEYLIGLQTKIGDALSRQSFWADTADAERRIFEECIEATNRHPDAPIYHFGSYEPRAFSRATTKFGLDCTGISKRLINLNTLVFGKVYFPTRSNRLKDLGALVGATWSAPISSGLESIGWRYRWQDTGEREYKEMLLRYNQEDCQAVRLLKEKLKTVAETAAAPPDVDFPTTSRTSTTKFGQGIHDNFDGILKSAHMKYQQQRIKIRSTHAATPQEKRPSLPAHRPRKPKSVPSRAGKVIRVPRKRKCQQCDDQDLRRSRKVVEHRMLDLAFNDNGCRKAVVNYVGQMARCPECGYYYSPPGIKRLRGRVYERSFLCLTTYLRVELRLPVRVITGVVEAIFSEHVAPSVVGDFLSRMTHEYESSEEMLLARILQSPFIHCDEMKVSIQGIGHYAWVLTDGSRVVFRLTDTREISTVRQLLLNYHGVLVSDFYAGYDSVACRQQKCLVHLIRDLNDDLWKNPFNEEYEHFVGKVRDLLLPVFDDVGKRGLKSRFLRKHMKGVDRFYASTVDRSENHSELVETYKKRFTRYRDSLFLFLNEDGIPWNNNMAERALRHLSVQQKISGCFVGKGARDYLRLLGISQSCRFQDKPFLKFLLSGERDVDKFRSRRQHRHRM